MKYRKKAVVVEASQWWKPGDHAAVIHPVPAEVPIPPSGRGRSRAAEVRASLGVIQTLEGWMLVTPGDFIICGVHGEHYACKPEIFLKTYEAVEDDTAA
jgi:hypothetical protein